MFPPRSLLARLNHDLAELQECPYPGVAVFTNDANLRKLCLVLTPPSGPWKDLALHFDVELPNHWPSSPPMIFSSVDGIKHPNLFGNWICCDLLKEQEELERGYTGGYSPALTLRGLFLQFLTFFSSTKVEQDTGNVIDIGDYILVRYERDESLDSSQERLEQLWNSSNSPEVVQNDISPPDTIQKVKDVRIPLRRIEYVNPRWHSTYKLISQWRCKTCPYGSDSFPVYRNISAESREHHYDPPTHSPQKFSLPPCLLEMLNDDILMELATHLLSESLVAFSIAYPRFWRLAASTHVLLQRELRCFFLRTGLQESILGIGIMFDPNPRTLSSDFDWLSKEAFDQYEVRKSIQKRDFQYFLPLAFSRPHFERVEHHIWAHLATLDRVVRDGEEAMNQKTGRTSSRQTTPPQQPYQTVGVIYKMMNNIVVSLMKTCDDVLGISSRNKQPPQATLLHASEKAVISYGHLFHLLLCLSRTTPAILHEAVDRLHRFKQEPTSRVKAEVPDLGEFIILITFVLAHPPDGIKPVHWTAINGPFLEEAIVRNVRWVLKSLPVLEVMEEGTSDYRLHQTFLKSMTSLRLIMFQITFLDIFVKTYASNLTQLDDNYGFPEPSIPERMVKEIKAIYKVNTWPGFFERAHYARGLKLGKEKLSEMFRKAIHTSAEREYHIPKRPRDMHLLWKDRENLERQWIKSRNN